MSYAADQIRRVLSHGPVPGEDFYRLKVSGYTNTQWVNITPAELEEIADLLDEPPDPMEDELPPAFAVAAAQYPGKALVRCPCGALHPAGEPCPYSKLLAD